MGRVSKRSLQAPAAAKKMGEKLISAHPSKQAPVIIGHHAVMTATAGPTGWTCAQTALLLAAIVTFVGTTISAAVTYGLNQRGARRERRARSYAEALSAIEDYAELPYRIRRRLGGIEARHELTEQISTVQSRIAFYQAWLRIEALEVSTAYEALVQAAKGQAGGQMKQAWRENIRKKDHEMNLGIAYQRDKIDQELGKCITIMRRTLSSGRSVTARRKHGRTPITML